MPSVSDRVNQGLYGSSGALSGALIHQQEDSMTLAEKHKDGVSSERGSAGAHLSGRFHRRLLR